MIYGSNGSFCPPFYQHFAHNGDYWDPEIECIWKRTGFDLARDPRKNDRGKFWSIENLVRYTNIVAELLETVTRILDETSPDNYDRDARWFTVKSFLWSSWQRPVLLIQWYVRNIFNLAINDYIFEAYRSS